MGARCGATKLSEDEVVQIRRLRADGESIGVLASRFGVSEYNIKAIVYRKSWRHLPLPDERVAPQPPAR